MTALIVLGVLAWLALAVTLALLIGKVVAHAEATMIARTPVRRVDGPGSGGPR